MVFYDFNCLSVFAVPEPSIFHSSYKDLGSVSHNVAKLYFANGFRAFLEEAWGAPGRRIAPDWLRRRGGILYR